MTPPGDVQRSRTTAIVFVAASVTGTVAAIATFWSLVRVEPGGRLLVAWIAAPGVVFLGALTCGLMFGIATASGRSPAAMLRRGAASAALLLVSGLALVGAYYGLAIHSEDDFSAERFRAALRAEDYEAMETEARRAVRSGDLIGMSPARLERELGPPTRVGRRRHLYVWYLGMINDFIGPGDDGSLYVQFDAGWRRVRSAKVDLSFR
jgi:hypothetical protein